MEFCWFTFWKGVLRFRVQGVGTTVGYHWGLGSRLRDIIRVLGFRVHGTS